VNYRVCEWGRGIVSGKVANPLICRINILLFSYDFDSWKHYLTSQIRSRYETLHKDLLYTDEQQDFDDALLVFEKINNIFAEMDE
jgi:hypothetical protein